MTDLVNVIKNAQSTHSLSESEIVEILQNDTVNELLFDTADKVRKQYVGDEVHLRGLIEFSNICRCNCFYCGLRKDNTAVQRYRMTLEEILLLAQKAKDFGYKTVVLQSGEDAYFDTDIMCRIIQEIKEQNPGGYILFGRDFENETKQSILQELTNCQENSKIGLVLGVDEEGGTVVRVSAYKAFRNTKFLSPQQIWAQGQLGAILKDSTEKSTLLKSIGLNMNLTPVADVPTKTNSFIYKRAYGRGAEKTAIYVEELIKTMNQDGMISTMKHFPGYGDNVDTHTGIAIDERPYSTFETVDFLPFKSGIEAKGPTILVNHNIVKCMDAEKPASLSEKVHEILREELNFSGIIMTDDLAMDAVKSYVENGEAAVQAVLAGNDMIISSNFAEQKQEILNAIKNKKISEDIINKAVKRILAFKYAYNIIK